MFFLKKIYRKFTNWRWEIGFVDNSFAGLVDGEPLKVHWVELPFRDRWFADPYILDYNEEEIIVLGEEYSDELLRGRIAKLVVDRKTYKLKSWKIILDLPTHLSFPRVVRKNGEIFIHPENSQSGCHTLYRYDSKKDTLVDGKVIADSPLTDSVMLNYNGHDLLFSTFIPDSNGNTLSIYERKGDDLKYNKVDEVTFDSRIARMAGDFFEVNGKLYRPAQDCNKEYGNAVIIQEASCDANGKWHFKSVRRMTSPHPILKRGFHTLNHYSDMIVIDVKGYRYPKIGKMLESIRNIF